MRIFVTITNRSSQVKFIVVVSSCTRTIGRNLGKRDDQYQKLSYNIESEIEILSASLEFAILISYNGVHNSFRHVSALKRVAKLVVEPFLEPQSPFSFKMAHQLIMGESNPAVVQEKLPEFYPKR